MALESRVRSRQQLSNRIEHVTFNHGVVGSSPTALTKLSPFYKGFLVQTG
jgi:hypothetical protein